MGRELEYREAEYPAKRGVRRRAQWVWIVIAALVFLGLGLLVMDCIAHWHDPKFWDM